MVDSFDNSTTLGGNRCLTAPERSTGSQNNFHLLNYFLCGYRILDTIGNEIHTIAVQLFTHSSHFVARLSESETVVIHVQGIDTWSLPRLHLAQNALLHKLNQRVC